MKKKESNLARGRREMTEAVKLGKAEGRWTMEEHRLFMDGLQIHGKNWKQLESYISTRTSSQIRSHAQKYFNKCEKEQLSPLIISTSINKFPEPKNRIHSKSIASKETIDKNMRGGITSRYSNINKLPNVHGFKNKESIKSSSEESKEEPQITINYQPLRAKQKLKKSSMLSTPNVESNKNKRQKVNSVPKMSEKNEDLSHKAFKNIQKLT